MADTQQSTWFVQLPDFPGTSDARKAHHALHIQHNQSYLAAGKFVFGGAMLEAHPDCLNESPEVVGSTYVIQAGGEAEVRAMVQDDPYTKLGVWDVENAIIVPIKVTVSKPL